MRVVCIDDSNKPSDFPSPKWVVKGNEYTIKEFDKMNMQNGIIGVTLVEIDTSGCFPYTHFDASRFAPIVDQPVEELEEELTV